MSNNISQKAYVAHKHHNLSRRNTSATKLSLVPATKRPGLSRALSSPRCASSALGRKRISVECTTSGVDNEQESEDEMPTSFLQFCTFCEKQIVVPNYSILYCSERCRRKDTGDSSDASLPLSPKRSPPLRPEPNGASYPLVRQHCPSALAAFESRPAVLHEGKSDLDPTEWKPHSTRNPAAPDGDPLSRVMSSLAISECNEVAAELEPSRVRSSPSSYHAGARQVDGHARARSSAALSFLAQFHRSPEALSFTPRASYSARRDGCARTAPGYLSWIMGDRTQADDTLPSTGTSVTESGPGTPKEGYKAMAVAREDEEDAGNVLIRGVSSNVSLKSLAIAVEARDEEGFCLIEGVWMAESKAQPIKDGGEAKSKLKKLLGGA